MSVEPMTLPEYDCHKVVRAARIIGVKLDTTGPEPGTRILTLKNMATGAEGPWAASVNHGIWARYTPIVGDYFVVYNNNYISISPKKEFEEGYKLKA